MAGRRVGGGSLRDRAPNVFDAAKGCSGEDMHQICSTRSIVKAKGAVQVEALETRTHLSAPPNDMFADATVISSLPATYAATNIEATVETGEPAITANGLGYSVWWKWTANASGDVSFDTVGSEIDTVMAVFTGDAVSALSQVASNDDYGGDVTSLVSFNATAGTTYYIGVDVHWAWGDPGDFTFNAAAGGVANQTPVAVDDFIIADGWITRVIPVLDNDSDPEGDLLTVESVATPLHGTAVANPDGTITYSAEPGYVGADAFTYTISDGNGNSAVGTVGVDVTIPAMAHVGFAGTQGDDHVTAEVVGNVLRFTLGGAIIRQFVSTAVADVTILGLDGNDTISAYNLPIGVTISGGAGDDVLVGSSSFANWLVGGDGNDNMVGFAGDDSLYGGAGSDTIGGSAGDDLIVGASGSDSLFGGEGNDSMFGGTEGDSILGEAGDDLVFGGDGNDTIAGADGNDGIFGEAGDDSIAGGDGNDSMRGNTGNDTILGLGGLDVLVGDLGADELRGGTGSDLLDGRGGDDALFGEDAADCLVGMAGNDSCDGGAGNDSLYGGADNDTLVGNDGNDAAFGGLGNDSIVGGEGADLLFGDAGSDTFDSHDAADTRDSVVGGIGVDSSLSHDQSDLLVSVETLLV